MSDQIRVNGNLLSWGSITAKCNGEIYHGIKSISYGDKRERIKGYGQGRHQAPRGRSRGKYTTEPVKIGFQKGSAQSFRQALALQAPAGVSIGDVQFDIDVMFFEAGEIPMHVKIERCVLTADTSSHEEGADPLLDELEADCMLIRRNGLVLFDLSEGSP